MKFDEQKAADNDSAEFVRILDEMIETDETITARAVVRKHPVLKHASSITRNPNRTSLLSKYQALQKQFRAMRGRTSNRSKDKIITEIAKKDARIAELEHRVEILRVSHIAMIRAVGELGGTSKLLKLYDGCRGVRSELDRLGLLPHREVIEFER